MRPFGHDCIGHDLNSMQSCRGHKTVSVSLDGGCSMARGVEVWLLLAARSGNCGLTSISFLEAIGDQQSLKETGPMHVDQIVHLNDDHPSPHAARLHAVQPTRPTPPHTHPAPTNHAHAFLKRQTP